MSMEKQRKYSEHPGQAVYPNLEEPISVKGLGLSESPQIDVEGGVVVFSRWSEDLDDRVSFSITEWDLSEFIGIWLEARMDQRFGPAEDTGNEVLPACEADCLHGQGD